MRLPTPEERDGRRFVAGGSCRVFGEAAWVTPGRVRGNQRWSG
jgi:hypothetical protein